MAWHRSFPCSLQKEPALPTPWSWTSSLQNYEVIHLCCLSPRVYGTLLRQPKQTNTDRKKIPELENFYLYHCGALILIHYSCGIALIIFAIVTLQCLPLWERIYSAPRKRIYLLHPTPVTLDLTKGTLVDVACEQDSKCVLWCVDCPLELLLSLREQVLGGCGHISLGSRSAQNLKARTKPGQPAAWKHPVQPRSIKPPTAPLDQEQEKNRNAYCYQPLSFRVFVLQQNCSKTWLLYWTLCNMQIDHGALLELNVTAQPPVWQARNAKGRVTVPKLGQHAFSPQ